MNEWNEDESKKWYFGLADSDKLIFLALVTGHLTIHGRAFGLDLAGEQQIRAFKGLNELHHLISFHFAGIGMKEDRYPDDVFLEILVEKAASYGLSAQLQQSLNYARSRQYWNTSE